MTTTRRPQRQPGTGRPRLERLESRLVLSAAAGGVAIGLSAAGVGDPSTPAPPYLSTTLIDPAPGSTITATPPDFTVAFDQPINPFFLHGRDLSLEQRVAGAWVPVFGSKQTPKESHDAADTHLTLTPVAGTSLAPGDYRVVIPSMTTLIGEDGVSTPFTPAERAAGSEHVVGTFTVAKAGAMAGMAAALATPGTTPESVSGSIDLASDPDAVNLYRFTLPVGHHYRVGAVVNAQRIGSPALTALTLYDAQGDPIHASTAGRPDAPADPYLFAGLDPGTYFLGVSGQGDRPAKADGGATPGGDTNSSRAAGVGGAYRLDLVADPADAPVSLRGLTLNQGDPLSAAPTGFTLAFSGLLNLDSMHGDPVPGFGVTDAAGRDYPITAVGYQESSARYTFQFDEPVPAGRYTLSVPPASGHGATDLAGMTPVAPGQAAGVLATFDVAASPRQADPSDLGTVAQWPKGTVGKSALLPPGTATAYRFVLLNPGTVSLNPISVGGDLGVDLFGGRTPGASPVNAGAADHGSFLYDLPAGVYLVQFSNTGTTPMSLGWSLVGRKDNESLLNSGVGQGPALNLRLVAPASAGSSVVVTDPAGLTPVGPVGASLTSGPYSPAGPSSAAAPTSPASTVGGGSAAAAVAGGGLPSGSASSPSVGPTSGPGRSDLAGGLTFTVGETLVGRPTTASDHVGVVGPGSGALASAAPGLPPGLGSNTAPGRATAPAARGGRVGPGEAAVDQGQGQGQPEAADGAAAPAEPVNGAMGPDAAVAEAGPRADEAVIVAADGLARGVADAARWLARVTGAGGGRRDAAAARGGLETPDLLPPGATDADAGLIALGRDDDAAAADGLESDRVERAQLGGPLALAVASTVTARYQDPVRRWLRRYSAAGPAGRAPQTAHALRGPHRRR